FGVRRYTPPAQSSPESAARLFGAVSKGALSDSTSQAPFPGRLLMTTERRDSDSRETARSTSRRRFLKESSLVLASSAMVPSLAGVNRGATAPAASSKNADAVVDTASGRVRGTAVDGIKVFKGIPYGGTTAGKNRFKPPTKPQPWTGIRDCLEWGHIAPQPAPTGRIDYVRLIDWTNQP